MKKKLLAMILSVGLAAGLLPMTGGAYAASGTDESSDTVQEIARQFQDMTKDPFAFRDGQMRAQAEDAAAAYPEKFDLRNVNGESFVTPVKFQNPFGTCWGFSAITAAETSILGAGLAQQDGYDASTLDLSEKHLVNFLARPLDDPTDPQNGEGTQYIDKNLTLQDKFNAGGMPFYATSLFSSGMGPNLEDRTLTDGAPAGTPSDIYEYHGLNQLTDKVKINGVWADYCYSDQDDWSIPEQLRFTQSYQLKESYMLPDPARFDDPKDETHYEYDPAATAAIKEQLLQKRGVEIGFCADVSQPDAETGDARYISKNWAHYTYEKEQANHGVCIIGWDDNYDKSNFVQGHEPPENGAWLVKNSWGSGEQEFPNKGRGDWGIPNEKGEATGYFWISYYDQTINSCEALAFDKSNVNKQYYLDQYDYMPVNAIMSADVGREVSFSNVFRAEECQELEQISCQTAAPGTTVEYEIYLLPEKHSDPQDGMLAAAGTTQAFPLGGFHKIALETPIMIQKDQYYSIIITEITPEGKYNINAPAAISEQMAAFFQLSSWEKGIVNPGESFVKADGKWYDYSNAGFRKKLLGDDYVTLSVDNFPIKGYSVPKPNLSLVLPGGDEVTLEVNDERCTDSLRARFRGDKSVLPQNADMVWTPAAGSEKVFTTEEVPGDSSMLNVTAVAPGTGYIEVTAPGVGTQVVRVEVNAPPAPKMKLRAGKKSLKVSVDHSADYASFDGCQIRYRVKGTSKWKMARISLMTDSKKLKKLKSGKRYQVQARDLTWYNEQVWYGDWGKTVTSKKIR